MNVKYQINRKETIEMKKKYVIPTVKIVVLSEFNYLMAGSGTGAGETPITPAKGNFLDFEEDDDDEK